MECGGLPEGVGSEPATKAILFAIQIAEAFGEDNFDAAGSQKERLGDFNGASAR